MPSYDVFSWPQWSPHRPSQPTFTRPVSIAPHVTYSNFCSSLCSWPIYVSPQSSTANAADLWTSHWSVWVHPRIYRFSGPPSVSNSIPVCLAPGGKTKSSCSAWLASGTLPACGWGSVRCWSLIGTGHLPAASRGLWFAPYRSQGRTRWCGIGPCLGSL